MKGLEQRQILLEGGSGCRARTPHHLGLSLLCIGQGIVGAQVSVQFSHTTNSLFVLPCLLAQSSAERSVDPQSGILDDIAP